jgi:hypothetical protein
MIEDQIAKALLAGGDLLTLDDLRELAIAKRVQWWGDQTAAAATEVLTYPRRRILNLFMAAGDDVRDVLALQDGIVAFAQAMGCSHMVAHGRPGWGRIGRASGWLPHSIQFVREVTS